MKIYKVSIEVTAPEYAIASTICIKADNVESAEKQALASYEGQGLIIRTEEVRP